MPCQACVGSPSRPAEPCGSLGGHQAAWQGHRGPRAAAAAPPAGRERPPLPRMVSLIRRRDGTNMRSFNGDDDATSNHNHDHRPAEHQIRAGMT